MLRSFCSPRLTAHRTQVATTSLSFSVMSELDDDDDEEDDLHEAEAQEAEVDDVAQPLWG